MKSTLVVFGLISEERPLECIEVFYTYQERTVSPKLNISLLEFHPFEWFERSTLYNFDQLLLTGAILPSPF